MVVFIIIASFILVGFGKKEVELLNDGKLIDFSLAIELAKPGGNSSEDSNGNGEDLTQSDAEETEALHDNEQVDNGEVVVEISIRGEQLRYDGIVCDLEQIKKIMQVHSETILVVLIDDFAETHVYKKVLDTINELQLKKDIRYTQR